MCTRNWEAVTGDVQIYINTVLCDKPITGSKEAYCFCCIPPLSVWRSVSATVNFYLTHLPGQWWRRCYESKTRPAQFHLWLGMVIYRRVTGFSTLNLLPCSHQTVVSTGRVWFYIILWLFPQKPLILFIFNSSKPVWKWSQFKYRKAFFPCDFSKQQRGLKWLPSWFILVFFYPLRCQEACWEGGLGCG